MARARSQADVLQREYEALRRDVEYLRMRHRRGELDALELVARRIVERATRWAGELDPRALTPIAGGLIDGERPLDATTVLTLALARFGPGDHSGPASWARRLLVGAAEEGGRFATAVAAGETVLAAPWLAVGDRCEILALVAEAERQRGRIDAAAHRLGEADHLLASVPADADVVAHRAWVQVLRGVLACTAGDAVAAEACFRAALAFDLRGNRALVLSLAADAWADRGNLTLAAALLDEAEGVRGDVPRSSIGLTALVRGRVLADAGHLDEATDALDRAESLLVVTQRLPLVARVHRLQGRVLVAQGRLDDGRARLVQARDELVALGCELDVVAVDADLAHGRSVDGVPGQASG